MIGLLEDLLKERPRLAVWWTKVQERESFKKIRIVSFGLGDVMMKRICTVL